MTRVILIEVLAIVVTACYATAVYLDVQQLINNEEGIKKMRRSVWPVYLRLLLVLGGHVLVVWLHAYALQYRYVGSLIGATVILFIPTVLLLSTPFIKSLGKTVIILDTLVVSFTMVFLKMWGVL